MTLSVLDGSSSLLPAPSAEAFFATATSGANSSQAVALATIEASEREINRIRGYKIQLSPADNAQLLKIQEEIQEIEAKASDGTVRPDELEDRLELFNEADRIIGKPIVDIEADQTLAELSAGLDLILRPNLSGPIQSQVDSLSRIKATLEERIAENPKSRTLTEQFQSVDRILASLTPLRPVSDLSPAERRSYDAQVELINAYVGAKVELSSRESIKVAQLQSTIAEMRKLAPPDFSQQPTPAAVNRAAARTA